MASFLLQSQCPFLRNSLRSSKEPFFLFFNQFVLNLDPSAHGRTRRDMMPPSVSVSFLQPSEQARHEGPTLVEVNIILIPSDTPHLKYCSPVQGLILLLTDGLTLEESQSSPISRSTLSVPLPCRHRTH